MGILNWFRRKEAAEPSPVRDLLTGKAVVEFDEEKVTCRAGGQVETVAWSDLRLVLIQNTSDGPFIDDIFYVLVGDKGRCVVPSESAGAKDLVARLQQLPGFDNQAFISSMSCADDREFLCWKKPEQGPA